MIKLTVFTPTYNRAHTLPQTYESLVKQDCKDFIWLIVDDGSTDQTKELVRKWQRENTGFEIRYIYKPNGGMHTAHNTAYENIDTELNICIDSDDCLADGAVSTILNKWEEVKEKGYAGLIGLDADVYGRIIGKGFSENLTETTLSEYYASGGSGDKKLVYRTDIMKKYPPYPVFEREKYVPLSYKYLLCDQEYKLAVINRIICVVDYQPDGSSATMWKQYLMNPNGFSVIRKLDMIYPNSKRKLFIATVHYISCCFLAHKNILSSSPRKLITFFLIPFGWILSKYVKYKANCMEKKNDRVFSHY